MKFSVKLALPLLALFLSSAPLVSPANALDDTDKPEIEKIIRDYLLNNPGILSEMQAAQKTRKEAELVANQQKTLSEKANLIFSSKFQMEIGPKDAKYKVVEFYDYNCPFCQRAMVDMKKILATNPDVKFIIKEWPVLGQNSFDAHSVSIAFNTLMPEKYTEFHEKLLSLKGQKGKAKAVEIALTYGVDQQALLAEMEKPYVLDALRENNGLANDLGITGTPSYVIGDQVIFGAVGVDQLNASINKMMK